MEGEVQRALLRMEGKHDGRRIGRGWIMDNETKGARGIGVANQVVMKIGFRSK